MIRFFVALFFGLFCLLPRHAAALEKQTLIMGSGEIMSSYYPVAGALCRAINEQRIEHGLRCLVESTTGSIYNLGGLYADDFDLILVQSDWLAEAWQGIDRFQEAGKGEKMRILASVQTVPLSIIVRDESDIRKIDDLVGRRFNIGPLGSAARHLADALLAAEGWNEQSFETLSDLSLEDQVGALCVQEIDAMVLAVAHPNPIFQEIAARCPIRFLPIPAEPVAKILPQHSYLTDIYIQGDLYDGLLSDFKSFGYQIYLLGTKSLSNDAAYDLTKSIYEQWPMIQKAHPVLAPLSQDRLYRKDPLVPYHKGALRFYEQKSN